MRMLAGFQAQVMEDPEYFSQSMLLPSLGMAKLTGMKWPPPHATPFYDKVTTQQMERVFCSGTEATNWYSCINIMRGLSKGKKTK